jgi:mono/diheme cytochrome c family protein
MNRNHLAIAFASFALLATAACSKSDGGAAPAGGGPAKAAAAIPQEAKDVFAQRCVTCHGASGKGDGVGAAALNPKPRNYTDKEWQKSVTDETLKKIIVGGGPAAGKSPLMPPNPDLAAKPEVVSGLVAIVRGFGQ